MNIALVLMREVGVMAMLICLGAFTKKSGMLSGETARRLSSLLLSIVLPVMLVNTLQRDKSPALMGGFWAALILSILVFAISAVVATLVFRPCKDGGNRYKIERIAVALPNCGFMGIPILRATTGEDTLLYCAVVLGSFQLLVWCWAVPLMKGTRPTVKSIFVNPGMAAFLIGMALFLLELRLPMLLLSFMSHVSALNTPLSMLMTGIFLADIKLRDAFLVPNVYKAVLLRNLAVPLLSLGIIFATGMTAVFGEPFSLSFVILLACPCAASVLMLSLGEKEDGGTYAAKAIALSTIFSIVTMPLVAFVAERIL